MQFPNSLLRGIRKIHTSNKIKFCHFMYVRVPDIQYDGNYDDFPNLAYIRSEQSTTWSAYSLPDWTRFNDKKHYISNSGILGLKVKTILEININTEEQPNFWRLLHIPVEFNYSHCQFQTNKPYDRSNNLKNRILLKNNSIEFTKPHLPLNQNCFIASCKMYFHRIACFIPIFKGQELF